MIPKDLAALFDRRAARGDLGTADEQPAAQPTPKLAAAKPIEQAAPVSPNLLRPHQWASCPSPTSLEDPSPPRLQSPSAEPAAPAEAAPKPVEERATPGVTPEAGVEQKVEEKPPVAVKAPEELRRSPCPSAPLRKRACRPPVLRSDGNQKDIGQGTSNP